MREHSRALLRMKRDKQTLKLCTNINRMFEAGLGIIDVVPAIARSHAVLTALPTPGRSGLERPMQKQKDAYLNRERSVNP